MPLSVCSFVCVCVLSACTVCTLAFACVYFPNAVFVFCFVCMYDLKSFHCGFERCVEGELEEVRIYVSG